MRTARDREATPPQRVERILLIKPSSLGDVVHALPVLAGLREMYPSAHIAWLVGKAFAPLLEGHPMLDEVIRFDRARYGHMLRSPRAILDFCRFLWTLRRKRFDLVVDLQGLFRSGFMAMVSGGRCRAGFANAREMAWVFYSRAVRCDPAHVHAVDKNLDLAAALGVRMREPVFPLGLCEEELEGVRTLLDERAERPISRYLCLIPGARWESKRWPAEHFAALIDALETEGLPTPVLIGAPEDSAFADRIAAGCRAPVVNLVGRTSLRQLSALLAQAELVVCNDSGPMHIAAALGRPLVALFGPTNPARTGPYGTAARVMQLPLRCAPCYRRQCPLEHHRCMRDLPVERVMAAVREVAAALGMHAGASA